MAQRFSARITSAWAPTRVFDYLADFRNLPEWHPIVTSAELTTLDWSLRNARYDLRATIAGRRIAAEVTTTELERPKLIVATAQNQAAITTDRFELAPGANDVTVVNYSSVLQLKLPLRAIGQLMVPALNGAWDSAVSGLEGVIGAGIPRASGPLAS